MFTNLYLVLMIAALKMTFITSKYLGCLLLVSSNDFCCHLYYKIPLKYNVIKSIKQYCIHSKRTSTTSQSTTLQLPCQARICQLHPLYTKTCLLPIVWNTGSYTFLQKEMCTLNNNFEIHLIGALILNDFYWLANFLLAVH